MKKLLLALAIATLSTPAFAASGDLKAQALKVFEKNRDAVVWLSATVKQTINFDGPGAGAIGSRNDGSSEKVQALAVMIDPSGLLVTSLGSINQGVMIDGSEMDTPAGHVKVRAKTDLKDAKVILADGTEIPADLVMKDVDLDLAFFRIQADAPKAKGRSFTAVSAQAGTALGLLDDVVVVGRMDESMNREAMVFTSEVLALVHQPREVVRVQTPGTGVPVFTTDGKFAGITVLVRKSDGVKLDNGEARVETAVLPVKKMLKDIEQAKSAKPGDIKPEAEEPID